MFTHPQRVPGRPDEKPRYAAVRVDQYPFLLYKSARVVRLLPLLPLQTGLIF
jgi:hypothetical protein